MISAREAIGEFKPDDWSLDPRQHAGRMGPEAGPLVRLLESDTLQAIIDQYESEDRVAARYRASYQRLGRREIHATSAAAVCAAVLLYFSGAGTALAAGIRTGAVVLEVVCAAFAAATKFSLRQQSPYTRWQQHRAAAETARIELFETVCGLHSRSWSEEPRPGELSLGHLVELQKNADRVRQAAEQGNAEEVTRFIRDVNSVISVEHKEWIAAQEASQSSEAS